MIAVRVRCFSALGGLNSRSLLRLHPHRWKRQKLTGHRFSNVAQPFTPSSYKLPNIFCDTFRGYNWSRNGSGRHWWSSWWERLVKSVNRRCLLCAGAIFLWDRERVTNQELSKSLSKYERRVGEKLFKNEPTEKQCTIEQNDTSSDDVPLESVPVKDKASTDEQDETKKTKKSKAKSNRQYRSTSTRSKSKSVKSNKKNISPDKENEKTNKVANEQNPTEDHTLTNVNTKHQTVKEGVDITPSAEKGDSLEGWQLMSTQENCKVYSKPCGNGGLCQYKVIGFYENITARDFLDVQVSDDRMSWDTFCLSLKTIDRDSSTGSEVIHWVTKFPFPMSNRDYVFVRRHWISPDDDAIVIINRSVTHPSVPMTRRNIRVQSYFSEMVIKPTTFIDELGFNYELTYFDDPGSSIPSTAVAWATKSAMPDYLDKIYKAALMRLQVSSQHKHLT